MSKRPRIVANLPNLPRTVYAPTERLLACDAAGAVESDATPSAPMSERRDRSTKRQIYVLDVDQIGWIKRLALHLFEVSSGSDPGQSAIVRAILRGVMDAGIDLAAHASTPDEVRELIRSRLAGSG